MNTPVKITTTSAEQSFRIWMVRSGTGGYLIDEFLDHSIVSIGWNETAEIDPDTSYTDLKGILNMVYSDWSAGRINQSAGQIWRFVMEFEIGDKVVTYDSSARQYYIGEITSEYRYSEDFEYHHYRKVRWDETPRERDLLSLDSKNTLGSTLTIFEIPCEVWTDLEKNNAGYLTPEEIEEIEEVEDKAEELELVQLKEDVVSQSLEFIKDILSKLSWQETERLVAGLLKTMGYKIRMTSRGSDLGSDMIASPDQLGLEEPRIKVEVKQRTKHKISAPDIRTFIGGLRGHHKGIYVTTTGFSKEAKYEAERANFPITLIDSDWLVELIVSNYETLEPEYKALIPLQRIYWPV